MTFDIFSEYLQSIEATSSRLEMTRLLAELFNKLDPNEVNQACWLLLGQLGPKYENLEFSFAEKMMLRALSEFVSESVMGHGKQGGLGEQEALEEKGTHGALGKKGALGEQMGLLTEHEKQTPSKLRYVTDQFKKIGDLGNVAEELLQKTLGKNSDHRSMTQLYADLLEMAKDSGVGSQERKLQLMIEMLRQSNAQTAKYIVRIVLGTLRLGFSEMTMLDALSWSKTGNKSLRELLELAYQKNADVGRLASTFLSQGLEAIKKIEVQPGTPLFPALCQRLKTADEMIEKMGEVIVEPKYDGTRVNIHVNKHGKDWKVRTFTRNLDESSGMFPELLTENAIQAIKADVVILDSEAVGYDTVTGKLLPFQQTIQRKRKHEITETAARIPLRFFVFDVLFKDGKSLLRLPLSERKKILDDVVTESGLFVKAPYIVTNHAEELRKFHTAQLAEGLEGAVIKQLHSEYQPGRRGWSWVKFKEEEGASGKLSDTIDCVVMGYYTGQGKRTSFGMGAFLVGIRGENDKFYTIAKIGTGLSDLQWKELYTRCQPLAQKIKPKEYSVPKGLIPDVWISPSIVVEIAADEITRSPLHTATVALRFPRLVKFRDDKASEQVTTRGEIQGIV